MIPLKDTIRASSFPVVNICLIAINSFMFLVEIWMGPELQHFIQTFGVVPARYFSLTQTDPGNFVLRFLPILVSMFLHGGWVHIIGNMWFLWIFGDNVEDRMGHLRYLIFYLLSGIGAALLHIYLNPTSTVPTIGASGAISGVMGAYFLLFPHARIITLIPIFFFIDIIELPAILFIGYWIALQFFGGAIALSAAHQAGGVAWWAHVGGFFTGMVLLPFFKQRKSKRAPVYPDQYFPW